MQNSNTIADLVALAIQTEWTTEALYRGFSEKFSDYPKISEFWKHYASEEQGHARWLQNLTRHFAPERFDAPADPDLLRHARRLQEFDLQDQLSKIKNLQDAFELANELEHAETNAIFEFLIAYFSDDPNTSGFLRTQLRDHVSKLVIDFPEEYRQGAVRRAVLAKE
jgi:hypothetical protein